MFNKANLSNLMKQAEKMQEKMKQTNEELANVLVSGESGAGLVKISMNAHKEIKKVTIDETLIKEAIDDKEVLEDLIAAALTDAMKKADEATQDKMASLGGGFDLPDNVGSLFK